MRRTGWVCFFMLFLFSFMLTACDDGPYEVVFEDHDGEEIEVVEVLKGESLEGPTPSRDGFVFEGWVKEGTVKEVPFTFEYEEDITLTAQWVPNGIDYDVTDEGVVIRAYTGDKFELELPATIKGRSLVKIGEEAFAGTSITSVHIPESITRIGASAFYEAASLEQVTFEENSELKVIEGAIGTRGAFEQTTALSEITLPASVERIGRAAFRHSALETVDFAQDAALEVIGVGAFGHTSLSEVHIPAGVEVLEPHAFEKIPSLETVTFAEDSALKRIEQGVFANTSLTGIEIPADVEYIGASAFTHTFELSSFTFEGDAVKTIGMDAFWNAMALEEIHIPSSGTEIGMNAFNGADFLTIYTAHESKPEGWHEDWNPDGLDVHWGVEKE